MGKKRSESEKLDTLNLPNYQNLLAGLATGVVSRTVTSPIDVVKVLIQVGSSGGSAVETVKSLIKEDGIKAFWRGNGAAVLNVGPQTAIKFCVRDYLTKTYSTNGSLTNSQRALFGAISALVSQTAAYPFDVISTRKTVNPRKYQTIFQSIQTIIKEESVTGLWSGLTPNLAGAVVMESAQYVIGDSIRKKLTESFSKDGKLSPLQSMLTGSLTGACSQVFSHPFDVMRKRMMLTGPNGEKLYNSIPECALSIYKNDGVTGFYRGFGLNMIKTVPYFGVQFFINDQVKLAFARFNQYQESKKNSVRR